MTRLLIATFLLASTVASAQDGKEFILAANRAGVIELLDPISLQTISRIHIDIPPNSVGLNAISANSDGSKIYVEGPIADDPKGCCSLYSIDLATLSMNQAVSIAERDSGIRKDFGIKGINNDRLNVSPDGHWLFGVRTVPAPALEIYDLVQGSIVRQLTPTGLKGNWIPRGAWSGDHFYFYAPKADGSSARLWIVSAGTTELGEGIAVDSIAQSPGCPQHPLAIEEIAAAANKLFVYEAFGFIGDRRVECPNSIQGGAWLIDSSSGRLLSHITPDLYFSVLIPDREDPVFYGLSNGGPNWEFPVKLVRIDARDGGVLQTRTLDTNHWHISIAQLRLAPEGDVQVIQNRRPTTHE